MSQTKHKTSQTPDRPDSQNDSASGVISDLEMLKVFVSGLNQFMGRGAGRILSESIHMKESAFSKFITDKRRQFDDKTFYAMGLMSQLKQEVVEGAELTSEGYLGPITFREWKQPDGELKYTWFPTK